MNLLPLEEEGQRNFHAARVTLKRRYFSLLPLFLLFQMNVSKGEEYDFYHDRVIGSNLTDVIKKGGGKEEILKI